MLSYPIWYLISNPNKKQGKKKKTTLKKKKNDELMAVTMSAKGKKLTRK